VFLLIGLLGYALVLAGIHWEALTENITDRVMVADSLLLLILTYPFVKALHELGHGYAVKRWGGEVHEIGVMFLVFMPVPYVDASAASEFRAKHRRAIVGAAGIIVELFLASLAMLVWVHAEEGLTRAFAFNVMLIGGISTLVFNGNPLLRFDGYYVLSDLIEIPNLDQRSKRYIAFLVQRYLFGIKNSENPVTAPGEAKWLFTYAITSFVYRLFIVAAIVLFVAKSFPLIGVLLAIWSVIMMFGVPMGKQVWFLLTSPMLRRRRGRAMAITVGAIGTVAAAVTLVPLPYATVAEGVVWTPNEAAVYAGGAGHVASLMTEPGRMVAAGVDLLHLDDPVLAARVATLEAKVVELRYRLEAVPFDEPAEAKVVHERLMRAEEDFAHAQGALADLVVRSTAAGRFVLPEGGDVIGRYYNKGELIGYIADFSNPVLIVVVPEESADLVRSSTSLVEFRFIDSMANVWPARVSREVPKITDRLPNAALATTGGGVLSVDPDASGELRSLNKVLQLELTFDQPGTVPGLGGRVHVLFRHADQAIAVRAWRAMRQLFLREFSV
jgi:putative peptide zinc metalloprotease protein